MCQKTVTDLFQKKSELCQKYPIWLISDSFLLILGYIWGVVWHISDYFLTVWCEWQFSDWILIDIWLFSIQTYDSFLTHWWNLTHFWCISKSFLIDIWPIFASDSFLTYIWHISDSVLTVFCKWQFYDRILTDIWLFFGSFGTNIEHEYQNIIFSLHPNIIHTNYNGQKYVEYVSSAPPLASWENFELILRIFGMDGWDAISL